MENKKKNIKVTAVTGEFEKDKVKIVDSGELTIPKEKEKTKEQDDLIV